MTLTSHTHGPASGGAPRHLVIALHGLGADGRDLLGLAPYFAETLPHAVFVAPDGPEACDFGSMGGSPGLSSGHQWFSLQNWSFPSILAGLQRAAPVLTAFIAEQQAKHGVPPERTALIGFSQGTMMSLYAAPRLPAKIAGIVAYSGALIWAEETDIAALHKVPVLLIHGDADGVVPVAAYHAAHAQLTAAGFPVSGGVTRGLMHNIDEQGLADAAGFLKRVLGVS